MSLNEASPPNESRLRQPTVGAGLAPERLATLIANLRARKKVATEAFTTARTGKEVRARRSKCEEGKPTEC